MSVYAEVYQAKAGHNLCRGLLRAVLYFLNELKKGQGDPLIRKYPVRAIRMLDFMRDGLHAYGTPTLVHHGLPHFDITAADILTCRPTRQWMAPTGTDVANERTCDICDIRGTARPIRRGNIKHDCQFDF